MDTFSVSADDERPEASPNETDALVDESGVGDSDAHRGWASIHGFLGRDADAIALYRSALDGGAAALPAPEEEMALHRTGRQGTTAGLLGRVVWIWVLGGQMISVARTVTVAQPGRHGRMER